MPRAIHATVVEVAHGSSGCDATSMQMSRVQTIRCELRPRSVPTTEPRLGKILYRILVSVLSDCAFLDGYQVRMSHCSNLRRQYFLT